MTGGAGEPGAEGAVPGTGLGIGSDGGCLLTGGTGGAGLTAHAASPATTTAKLKCAIQYGRSNMWLILLEAALALALLVFIVWWTMFDKRKKKD